jgi:hypothetical protein
VKFIFADSLDVVDPSYDFTTDQPSADRQRHWDECYPHELMKTAPYDGVLVSRGIVGDHRFPGKYSGAQVMRFRRDGARKFLRLEGRFKHMPIFGDSGAFQYVKEKEPPYTPAQLLDFYADAKFTHGCALDHVIFDFEREEGRVKALGSEEARYRSEITLQNAREFFKLSKDLGPGFTPIGVAQGWSPSSLANAAAKLEKMGYAYIALGGLVPLRAQDIHRCLEAVCERLSDTTRLHLLGFAKAESIDEFKRHVAIASFDSTSPLLRAFKDARSNYYTLTDDGLDYYAAVRIPQALENTKLVRAVKEGKLNQEDLLRLEQKALAAVRGYDRRKVKLEDAVEAVADYGSLLDADPVEGSATREKLRNSIREATRRTLHDRPWSNCSCEVCKVASVEVVIFRSSNRNKRRGFHNLGVFFEHLSRYFRKELPSEHFQVPRPTGTAKQ